MSLRAIIKHSFRDSHNGMEGDSFYTVDFECPQLEADLRKGGYSERGYERHEIVGVELLTVPATSEGGK